MSTGGAEPVSFDRALEELDRIVARMEQGDVGLEEAVALFEEGRRHLATCRERLATAQQRIEELTADDLAAGEEEAAEPF